MSYLDIDQLLAEEERIPCIFSVDAHSLGSLDSTLQSDDLPAHSKVDLPLWLAHPMTEKNMVEIEIPKHFGSRMRDAIMAGPTAVNLKEFSYYFFDVGIKICRMTKDNDLLRTLRVAFSSDRYKSLMAHTLSR